MLPLPEPQRGGSILALQSLFNLASYGDLILVVAWLLAALRPAGPYPFLALAGEQGSAKTVACKLLKALIDPSIAPVRTLPREERELMIAATNAQVLAFDNLSGLPAWISDALCRLGSGGSLAVRQLYSDDAELHVANRRAMTEHLIDADPVATCVRDMMANRNHWAGTASDFLLAADKLLTQKARNCRTQWSRI